jgi:hypothetical protein
MLRRLCRIGLTADDVFGKRIRSLGSVGLGKEDLARYANTQGSDAHHMCLVHRVRWSHQGGRHIMAMYARSMTAKSLRWVTASGGVQQPLDFLVNKAGFSKQEVGVDPLHLKMPCCWAQ